MDDRYGRRAGDSVGLVFQRGFSLWYNCVEGVLVCVWGGGGGGVSVWGVLVCVGGVSVCVWGGVCVWGVLVCVGGVSVCVWGVCVCGGC